MLTALTVWVLGAEYSLCFNAENKFIVQMAELQDRWARKMESEHGHKVIIMGGSNVMFSIICEQLVTHYDLPAANMGLNAGIGAQVIAERAVAQAHAGDTLVLAFEPGLLTGSLRPPAFGIQFSYAMHRPDWAVAPTLHGTRVPIPSALLALRPGASHIFTLLAKLIAHKPLYSYQVANASPSGWNRTAIRRPLPGFPAQRLILSDDARQFLRSFRDWSDQHQVRVVYSLPWHWTPPDAVKDFQRKNAEFLLQISEYLPVLRDPLIGADSRIEDFSDLVWHLDEEGSVLRTEELGRELTNWQLWQPHELRRIVEDLSAASPASASAESGSPGS